MSKILLIFLGICISPLVAEDCDEIAFDEECCSKTHHRHYRLPQTPEEEHLWQERSDASWAGKRDDNVIDAFLHQ